jgi:hypothetical protein
MLAIPGPGEPETAANRRRKPRAQLSGPQKKKTAGLACPAKNKRELPGERGVTAALHVLQSSFTKR